MVSSTPASAASPLADHQKCDQINKRSCANSSIRGSPSAKSPGPSTSIPQPSIGAARHLRACEVLMSVFRPSQPHRPFARRGEMVSNRREDHEVSMLSLHLLQNCMVYINTLMLQQVLGQSQWSGKI